MTIKNTEHCNCCGLWAHFGFRGITYLLILLAVLLSIGYIRMERLLLPGRSTGQTVGNIVLTSDKTQLDAFWYPGTPGMPVILFSHGNGEHLQLLKPLLQEFTAHQYGILAYDYAGYGGSTGSASESQVYSDAEAAYRFLTEHEKIPASRIILFGYSVGSGPSCYLAEKYPSRGLVLCASFASAIQVLLPFSLPGDRFPNARRLRKHPVDLLIFHGKKDSIIPFRNSQKIYDTAVGKKKLILVEDADHNDLLTCLGETFWNELKSFVKGNFENDKKNY